MPINWNGRPVLITGAGGFIGSHLTEHMLNMGAHVRALIYSDREGRTGYLSRVPEEHKDRLQLCFGNIRDASFVNAVTRGMDTVFHLAASTSVVYSFSNPDDTIITNVTGTLNVCSAARHEGVRRLIHTSSAGVYGSLQSGSAITEKHPLKASNPYTASKLAADNIVESFFLSYDLPVVLCRIFNVYGPRVSPFLVIPTIVLQIMEGKELKLGDLSPTRNFTYVDDIVNAFVRMAESDKVAGEVVNFGSSEAVTIGQLAHMIAKIMNVEISVQQDPKRLRPEKGEIHRVVADTSKAKELVNWEPQISLEEGLRRTIAWIKDGGYQNRDM
jgi:nucleoside-diphosphate-sugar epimerase